MLPEAFTSPSSLSRPQPLLPIPVQVGEAEVKKELVEVAPGVTRLQSSTVHIKKCRYLEESACVGLCFNMCKVRPRAGRRGGIGCASVLPVSPPLEPTAPQKASSIAWNAHLPPPIHQHHSIAYCSTCTAAFSRGDR